MTTLERVARAIHEEQREAGEEMFDRLSPVEQARYLRIAGAGLWAARSPGEAIISDNMDYFADPCYAKDANAGFNAIIQSIINEADA
jgi:hypothetical protein